jgi:hypothetical protein
MEYGLKSCTIGAHALNCQSVHSIISIISIRRDNGTEKVVIVPFEKEADFDEGRRDEIHSINVKLHPSNNTVVVCQ